NDPPREDAEARHQASGLLTSATLSVMSAARPGRNDPCHCGSGKKYKHCCLQKDEAEAAAARAKAAETQAPAPASEPGHAAPPRAARHQMRPPVKGTRSRGIAQRTRLPRKVGGS